MNIVKPDVEAVFVVEVRGTEVWRLPLVDAFDLMLQALADVGGNPEAAKKALLAEFARKVAVT